MNHKLTTAIAKYNEISEEFRLFHNLYHDKEKDEYIKIDDEGNEHRVAVVEPNHIQIRLQGASPVFGNQRDVSINPISLLRIFKIFARSTWGW